MNKEQVEALGYFNAHQLPTGEWAALLKMIYTVALFVGIDETGWRTRFCYPTAFDAGIALLSWDGQGDPPGPWIKEKPGDRPNPMLAGIPIVAELRDTIEDADRIARALFATITLARKDPLLNQPDT